MASPSSAPAEKEPRLVFPVVDLSGKDAAREVGLACSTWGAFVAVGHSIPETLCNNLLSEAQEFFALPQEAKEAIHVKDGGKAWRGYMPHGGERSAKGKAADRKEGLYLGPEHPPEHPRVVAGDLLFGPNQWPKEVPGLRGAALDYIEAATRVGDRCMELVSESLGLPAQHIAEHVTRREPLAIVRVWCYPPQPQPLDEAADGIGAQMKRAAGLDNRLAKGLTASLGPPTQKLARRAHSDFGLWTMIIADAPGLQFRHPGTGEWVDVPCVPGGLLCNVGDALDRMTGGRFISAHNRARNLSASVPRLSVPVFYDPAFDAPMWPLPLDHLGPPPPDPGREERWRKTTLKKLEGAEWKYYLAKKVSKIFPDVIPPEVADSITVVEDASTRHALVVQIRAGEA